MQDNYGRIVGRMYCVCRIIVEQAGAELGQARVKIVYLCKQPFLLQIVLTAYFLLGHFPVRWCFCVFLLLWGPFPLSLSSCESSFCERVFLWGCLSVTLSSCEVIFLERLSSCEVVFLLGCLLVRSSWDLPTIRRYFYFSGWPGGGRLCKMKLQLTPSSSAGIGLSLAKIQRKKQN